MTRQRISARGLVYDIQGLIVTGIEAAIRAWGAEKKLPQAHLERWLSLAASDRAAILNVVRALRLRTGATASALELLEEIATREGESIAAILARGDIARIVKGSGSAPERARAFIDVLRTIRYPRLGETVRRLKEEIAALGLPRKISILLPKDLGSDELRVELRARSGAELKRLVEMLRDSADRIARIMDVLGGMDSSC
jgi:hypothetical protein